jgi:hypothetical protein
VGWLGAEEEERTEKGSVAATIGEEVGALLDCCVVGSVLSLLGWSASTM